MTLTRKELDDRIAVKRLEKAEKVEIFNNVSQKLNQLIRKRQLRKYMRQVDEVREYLEEEGSITALEALEKLELTQLTANIFVLRKEGMQIKTCKVGTTGRKHARYVLIK